MFAWKPQAALMILLPVAACVFFETCEAQDGTTGGPGKGAPSAIKEGDAGASAVVSASQTGADSKDAAALGLTVEGAILSALANNRELLVQRAEPDIRRTFERSERAAFDPVLGGEISRERTRQLSADEFVSDAPVATRTDTVTGRAFIEEFLPTGTRITLEGSTTSVDSSLYADRFTTTRVGVTATQALLRGMPLRANLAALRQARLDTRISEYELRGFIETLVADVEKTYWSYAVAERRIAILEQSLALAEQQWRETRERINVGRLSEAELAAAEAEVAQRREELIDARSTVAKTRLLLLRLINPPGEEMWDREIVILNRPEVSETALDPVRDHVALALRMRPDLNQARLRLQQQDLEVVKTRNGLLPKLDFFITLGRTGYAESFRSSTNRLDVPGDEAYNDITTGLTLEFPLFERDERALYQRAKFSRTQARDAIGNLEQLVNLDVRSAYIEVERSRGQVSASATTRRLRAETLRSESEKFKVGKSTTFLVARAQRDLLDSELTEVSAIVTYLKAVVDLYRLEGALIERRGLSAPGDGPVDVRP